jgi:hypothetical protein
LRPLLSLPKVAAQAEHHRPLPLLPGYLPAGVAGAVQCTAAAVDPLTSPHWQDPPMDSVPSQGGTTAV